MILKWYFCRSSLPIYGWISLCGRPALCLGSTHRGLYVQHPGMYITQHPCMYTTQHPGKYSIQVCMLCSIHVYTVSRQDQVISSMYIEWVVKYKRQLMVERNINVITGSQRSSAVVGVFSKLCCVARRGRQTLCLGTNAGEINNLVFWLLQFGFILWGWKIYIYILSPHHHNQHQHSQYHHH